MGLTMMIALIGIAALCVGAIVYYAINYLFPDPSPVEDRLTRVKSMNVTPETEEAILNEKLAKMYTSEYDNEALGQYLDQYDKIKNIKLLLSQAGLTISIDRFVTLYMVAPVVAGFLLGLVFQNIALILLGIVIPGLSVGLVRFLKARRFNKIVTQLPDTLNLVTSSLRAGHAFQSALSVVSTEMPKPISVEFATIVRDINMGIPVKETLNKMVHHLDDINDVRMFVTAVQIQRESGGNLAEILDKLSYTIRERFKLKGQISSLTGQSRLTGYMLGAAPIVLLIGLTIFKYDYVSSLYESELGNILLIIGLLLQILGFFIIRKIIDIRI